MRAVSFMIDEIASFFHPLPSIMLIFLVKSSPAPISLTISFSMRTNFPLRQDAYS